MVNEQNTQKITQLEEEIQRLRLAIDELSLLNDLARVISSTMNLEKVIETIIKRSLRAVLAEQGTITMVNELDPVQMKTFLRADNSSSIHQKYHLNQNLVGWMLIHKKSLISNDFINDQQFSGVKKDQSDIKSLICVPLLIKNRLIGILSLFNKKSQDLFNEDDKRLLSIIATQSAQVLENARLYKEEKKKIEIEKELCAAKEVQISLLPKELPHIENFEFDAITVPASEIGGDYYDFLLLGDDKYEVVISDVAGKGLSAALLSTMSKGILLTEALQSKSPAKHLIGMNNILRRTIQRKSFITLLLTLIDPDTRSLTIANAGHCYPILFKANLKKTEVIQIKGMALNLDENILYDEHTIYLEPNDFIVLYSDGVVEAQNEDEELFGLERLIRILEHNSCSSLSLLRERIIKEIKEFSKGMKQNDDITLVIIRAI